MDYGQIISRSFEIAWRYKWLWIFGMFVANSFNVDFNLLMDNPEFGGTFVPDFNFDPAILLSFMFALLIWILILLVCHIISDIAIIDSVNRIERGGQYSFSIAFSNGLNHFFSLLGLNILMFLLTMVPIVLITIAIVVFFAIDTVVGVVSLLIFIPVFFFMIFLVTNIWQLSKRVLIVRNSSISDAISEGFYLVKNHFGKNILIFLIQIGFGIAFSIAIAIIFLIFGVPFGLVIKSLGLSTILAFFGAFLLGLPVSIMLGGYFGTFSSSLFTLFYFQLVEPTPSQVTSYNNNPPPTELPG